jgi:hypothetical protein
VVMACYSGIPHAMNNVMIELLTSNVNHLDNSTSLIYTDEEIESILWCYEDFNDIVL